MYEFKLPDIGEGLSEGELLEWKVKVGDVVAEGDDIAEISTDKVAVVLPSPRAGVVRDLLWRPGDVVPVGKVLLRMELSEGPTVAAAKQGAAASRTPPGQAGPTDLAQRPLSQDPVVTAAVRAAPMVRRYAQEQGVDLAKVAAGMMGREITRRDIDAFLAAAGQQKSTAVAPTGRRERLTGARLAAAQRLAQSSRTLATSTLSCEIMADAILAAVDTATTGVRLSPLAVIACGVCRALLQHPRLNAQIDEAASELIMFDHVNLGVAVDAPSGLMVPVVRDAQAKSAAELGESIATAAQAARKGTLSAAELQGATFTISSTGGLEQVALLSTTPIVNVPNVATLWVSRIRDRPRVRDGRLEAGPILGCSLSFDHRYIHGAEGIAFLNSLDESLRSPLA